MSRGSRTKEQRLYTVLERHRAWEVRTLADLRTAGYKFTSVEQAKRWLKATETVKRMSPDDVIELVARRNSRGSK